MKKLLFLSLLFASSVNAAWVVSDPVPATQPIQPTGCILQVDGTYRPEIPVVKNSSDLVFCKFDVSGVNAGSHTVTAKFVATDPVWGRLESEDSAPLVFSKPGNLTIKPGGLKLVP